MSKTGLLISIDSSNKKFALNQSKLLAEHIKSKDFNVYLFDFADRTKSNSDYIEKYESGVYTPDSLNEPYGPAVFYALNHFDNKQLIEEALDSGSVVICNSYVITSIINALQKVPSPDGIPTWIENLEYDMYGVPRPDISFVLAEENDRNTKNLETYCSTPIQTIQLSDHDRSLTAVEDKIYQLIKSRLKATQKTKNATISYEITKPKQYNEPTTWKSDEETVITVNISALAYVILSKLEYLRLISMSEYTLTTTDQWYCPNISRGGLRKTYNAAQKENLDSFRTLSTSYDARDIHPLALLESVTIRYTKSSINQIMSYLAYYNIYELIQIFTDGIRGDYKYTELDTLRVFSMIHNLTPMMGGQTQPVTLINYSPRNEFDAITHLIYPHSSLPFTTLGAEISESAYIEKASLLKTLSILSESNITYHFELLVEFSILLDLSNSKIGSLTIQTPTPHYGFKTPKDIENSDLEQVYTRSFYKSFELYQKLAEANNTQSIAHYSTLFGHVQRSRLDLNISDCVRLARTHFYNENTNKLRNDIIDTISQVHPVLGDIVKNNTN